MKKKRALGRGLSALLSDEASSAAPAVVELPLDQVHCNPLQPRKTFDESRLQELAESIKEHGVVQPVVCTREAEGYRLVVGERRCRAARLAGLKSVPALIREMAGSQILEVALIENLQREDLNPIEEAMAFSYLLSEHQMTQEQLAQKLGCSRPSVSNTLRLLSLPEPIRRDLEVCALSSGHARALLSLENESHQMRVWAMISQRALSVRQTEQLVRDLHREKPQKVGEKKKLSADWLDIQDHLTRQLGSRVAIKPGAKGKGKIELGYRSAQELERLVELLIYLGERVEAKPSLGLL